MLGIAFLAGFGLGFLVSVWTLDKLYRGAFKKFCETIRDQYLMTLRNKG